MLENGILHPLRAVLKTLTPNYVTQMMVLTDGESTDLFSGSKVRNKKIQLALVRRCGKTFVQPPFTLFLVCVETDQGAETNTGWHLSD